MRIAGTFRQAGTRLYAFKVESAIGSSISVMCRGKKCPFPVLRREANKRKVRLPAAQRFYPAGVRIIVRVEADGRIGDYIRWRVRPGKAPERTDHPPPAAGGQASQRVPVGKRPPFDESRKWDKASPESGP